MSQTIPHRPTARPRRGIILIFVVVLLVLLAIMGTAYLATTRADLVALRGRGAGATNVRPLLNNRATLDQTYQALGARLKKVVGVDDAQSQVDHPSQDAWLSALLPVRAASDGIVKWPWVGGSLAAGATPGSLFSVNAIGDPRNPGVTPAITNTERQDVEIGAIDLRATTRVQRDRRYPALAFDNNTAALAGDADGDGIADSFLYPIVINPGASGVNQYVDETNGVIYYYSYRVVDNSAQLHLGTALSRTSDFPIDIKSGSIEDDTDDETRELIAHQRFIPSNPANPNYGFFRSNVGLVELLRESLSIYTGQTKPNTPIEKDVRRLIDLRYPDLKQEPATTATEEFSWMMSAFTNRNPPAGFNAIPLPLSVPDSSHVPAWRFNNGSLFATGTENSTANRGNESEAVLFRSFGDMVEQQVLKHPTNPQSFYLGGDGNNLLMGALGALPGAENLPSLADKGGTLFNPNNSFGPIESALWLSLRNPTPNYVRRTDSIWSWFPAEQVQLWYEWTKNLDALNRLPTNDGKYGSSSSTDLVGDPDAAAFLFNPGSLPFNRSFAAPFNTSLNPGDSTAGMTTVKLQRSLRSIVTTYNGVSATAPQRAPTVPVGMPIYPTSGTYNLDAAPFGEYPASKVSAATGTKRQLWRAYWAAMTQSGGAGGWTTEVGAPLLVSATRYDHGNAPSNQTESILTGRDMALLRSAIAAVNTIDLRDDDEDITVLDVQLEQAIKDAGGNADPNQKLIARVYGTEKRPYITEVLYANKQNADAAGPAEGPFLAIEIYNPHDTAIDLSNYYVGILNRTAQTSFEQGTLTRDPSVSTVQIGPRIAAGLGTAVLPPGGYIVLTSGTATTAVQPPPPTALSGPLVGIGTLEAAGGQTFAVAAGNANTELVLARYRRADGVPTSEPMTDFDRTTNNAAPAITNDRFQELANGDGATPAIERMVPIETIPLNYLQPLGTTGAPVQYSYRRSAIDMTAGAASERWKCVYGGRFYAIDLTDNLSIANADPNARPFGDAQAPAWRRYEGYAAPIDASTPPVPAEADAEYSAGFNTLGVHETEVGVVGPVAQEINKPIPTMPIQIQNFGVDPNRHPSKSFPFNSPFARDMDILKVPFIGAYKIIRWDAAGAGAANDTYELFEQNALPTDAFLAEPDPAFATSNPSIGRFDERQINTRWAEDLFDHISARQAPAHDFFPDVPKNKTYDRSGEDPDPDDANDLDNLPNNDTIDYSPLATARLAYVGNDGLVRGRDGTTNTLDPVNVGNDGVVASRPIIRYSVGGEGAKRAGIEAEDVKRVSEANALIQGKININTAPPVVLRMLPWVVDPTTGMSGDAEMTDIVDIVKEIDDYRNGTSFTGFTSIADVLKNTPSLTTTQMPAANDAAQLLNAGDLSGKTNQPTGDLFSQLYNINRVSNLITTRSDVYTVYYSVQAWTYRPDGQNGWVQAQDTRLVGERRGAFVLDRSKSVQGGNVSGVITVPIANE